MKISLKEAINRLQKGEVIAVPTDTVYGLAAKMDHPDAVKKLFTIKERPTTNPMVLQFPCLEMVLPYLKETPRSFLQLAERFWPGALTLVLPIDEEKIPSEVRAKKPTAGFRISNHPLLSKIISEVYPLVIPSANPSFQVPAETILEVETYFGLDFPVVDNTEDLSGMASTILCYEEGKWKISRRGDTLTCEVLEKEFGSLLFHS